ncbi:MULTISPECIES: hypothetical protein [Mesorhizobium]|nr:MULTISPECIES: hypothetical protein [Mesorhizobium]ESY61406.1 hypothetical protein X742_34060 [Mesorhizobium sp. LNHC232B00]WJI37366.1 putative RiPP precursor [Mesorhizobium opportunistum]
MKKIYEKPSLNKREKLSAVTALTSTSSPPSVK